MLPLPVCPLRHTFRVSEPVLPLLQHASCFQPRAAPRPHLAPSNKKPDSKTCCRGQSQRLCGATPLDTASLPRPLIDCQHSQASYASFTSSATRHLSPRPSGAHIIGFGPCRHHTIADSLSVRLPFSSRQRFVKLFLCYHRIFPLSTDFDPLFQIFRPDRAPTRAERTPVRTHARAHTVSLLFRTARQIFPRALHSNAERSRTSSFSAHVSTRCPQALSASATHLTREKAAGAENTCAKPQADQHDLVRSTKSCPTAYGMFCIE